MISSSRPGGQPANLQGIWNDETDTALQRLPEYANQEFFTEAQRQALDELRHLATSE